MNKKQLAAFARTHGWTGDDARTPLAVIVQWLAARGVNIGAVSPTGVAMPAPQPVVAAAAAPIVVMQEPQPIAADAATIEEPSAAYSPMSAFDAYIERKVTTMLDAFSAIPVAAPVAAPTPQPQPVDVSAAVRDALRAMLPATSVDGDSIILPQDVQTAIAAAAAVDRPAADAFRGAVVTKELGAATVRTLPTPSSRAPAVDPSYQFDAEALRLALVCDAMRPTTGRLWLAGPPGSGKTQFASQYAARTGRPFFRINFEGSVERYELIGGKQLEAGSSVWQDGALTQAIQVPHAVVLLDEPSFCRAHNMASLHSLLERDGAITLTETGRVIRPAVGVLFILADNTMGQGDTSGRHAGTVEQNAALIGRMAYIHVLTPPSVAVETRLLVSRTGIAKEPAKLISEFSRQCRKANESGALVDAVSLRHTEALAHALVAGIPAQTAFTAAVVNKASMESAEALQQLFAAHLGDTLRAALNEPIFAPVDAQPDSVPSPDGMGEQA